MGSAKIYAVLSPTAHLAILLLASTSAMAATGNMPTTDEPKRAAFYPIENEIKTAQAVTPDKCINPGHNVSPGRPLLGGNCIFDAPTLRGVRISYGSPGKTPQELAKQFCRALGFEREVGPVPPTHGFVLADSAIHLDTGFIEGGGGKHVFTYITCEPKKNL